MPHHPGRVLYVRGDQKAGAFFEQIVLSPDIEGALSFDGIDQFLSRRNVGSSKVRLSHFLFFFAGAGVFLYDSGHGKDECKAVAAAPDNKIVAAGSISTGTGKGIMPGPKKSLNRTL